MNVIVNEWMDVNQVKPFRLRVVIVRFEDGDQTLGMWNGAYWTNKKGEGRIDRTHKVTHFYVYERFIDKQDY